MHVYNKTLQNESYDDRLLHKRRLQVIVEREEFKNISVHFRAVLWVALSSLWPFDLYCVLCLVIQLCPTFCSPTDGSPPGSSVHRIFQARILGWVAISYLGNSPSPGTEAVSLAPPTLACRFFITAPVGKLIQYHLSITRHSLTLTSSFYLVLS